MPSVGEVSVDIAFGGMWYVIVRAELLGLDIRPEHGAKLARLGEMIKVATRYPVIEKSSDRKYIKV